MVSPRQPAVLPMAGNLCWSALTSCRSALWVRRRRPSFGRRVLPIRCRSVFRRRAAFSLRRATAFIRLTRLFMQLCSMSICRSTLFGCRSAMLICRSAMLICRSSTSVRRTPLSRRPSLASGRSCLASHRHSSPFFRPSLRSFRRSALTSCRRPLSNRSRSPSHHCWSVSDHSRPLADCFAALPRRFDTLSTRRPPAARIFGRAERTRVPDAIVSDYQWGHRTERERNRSLWLPAPAFRAGYECGLCRCSGPLPRLGPKKFGCARPLPTKSQRTAKKSRPSFRDGRPQFEN